MGQGLSCGASQEHGLFRALQLGDLGTLQAMLQRDPSLLHQTSYDRNSALHIAAAIGQIEVGFLGFALFGLNFWCFLVSHWFLVVGSSS
uniref:Uncharacterized protein MANES_11G131400 n=1 Tax=Rhizophora mucronata TaxID=61149 RepID=A0A2P2LEA7_RHIMU